MKRITLLLLLFLIGWFAYAGDDLSPVEANDLDTHRLARAISLDLRGRVLEQSEIEDINQSSLLDTAAIDAWMQTEDFEEQVINMHRSLFWNKVDFNINPNLKLYNYGQYMGYSDFAPGIYWVRNRSTVRRGGYQTHCSDYPADVNPLNQPQTWKERGDDG